MKAHFIAIGGAVMHNLALSLLKKGHTITGSDDEIYEPSRTRLAAAGILPAREGWDAGNITPDLDIVILGMHARPDNPELIKARELKLRIMSFPEYIYEQTKEKTRIVVGGSHGKTTTTAMIMHVLKHCNVAFDYLAGSSVDGYETMVDLNAESAIAVIEGDEYLTSPVDRRPKFHLYKPHIAIINGIAWDHMNVFTTFDDYCYQFELFASTIEQGGSLIYYKNDIKASEIALKSRPDIRKIPYDIHGYFINKKGFFAVTVNRTVRMNIFGAHNMQNLSAAREACLAAGIDEDNFYDAISSFTGTARRLQLLAGKYGKVVYTDFAHAPSKVKATVEAVRERHQDKKIIAVLELHTYSSLNAAFLPFYNGTLNSADIAYVYFNPHALAMKKLQEINKQDVYAAFGKKSLRVFDDSSLLFEDLSSADIENSVCLFMSSGDFNGADMQLIAGNLVNR